MGGNNLSMVSDVTVSDQQNAQLLQAENQIVLYRGKIEVMKKRIRQYKVNMGIQSDKATELLKDKRLKDAKMVLGKEYQMKRKIKLIKERIEGYESNIDEIEQIISCQNSSEQKEMMKEYIQKNLNEKRGEDRGEEEEEDKNEINAQFNKYVETRIGYLRKRLDGKSKKIKSDEEEGQNMNSIWDDLLD